MGTIGYEPNVDSFFGIPRSIKAGGISFDIPLIHATATNNGDPEKNRQFTVQTGMLSSTLEHRTPEQLFPDPSGSQADAISAMKAMQKASVAGQRIYQITKDNMAAILPNIHHDSDTMSEISASLNAGKEVITHTDKVSVPGWSGAGYIILDTKTGDGAYKISGGGNGGLLAAAFFFIGTIIIFALVTGAFFLAAVAAVQFVLLSKRVKDLVEEIDDPDVLQEKVNQAIFIVALATLTALSAPLLAASIGAEGVALSVFLAGILGVFGLTI